MKKNDQLTLEGFNPINSNSESTLNSHIYKSTEEISGNKAEFLTLRNNRDYKCSQCGSLDETMYVSEDIFCSKCLPVGHKMGIPNKNWRSVSHILSRESRITKALTKDKLMDLYYKQNKSLQDIAKEYNCTRQMVKLLMENYNLKRRTRSEARILAIKQNKFKIFHHDPINEKFFKEWTPQMAWILGLFLTDGCLYKSTSVNYAFAISLSDIELINKIMSCLNSQKKIIEAKQSYNRARILYRFEIHRDDMINDLINLGLTQRKSLNLKFPDVPEKYMRHFIRGCWDGDGTVYLTRGSVEAKYCCGSKYFIKRLLEELFKVGICKTRTSFIPLRIYEDHRSKNISYSIKLNSRHNTEKLFHYFYDEVDESMYLYRKYELFLKGLQLGNVVNNDN